MKLLSSVVPFLRDCTSYLPSGRFALSLAIGLEESVGGPRGTSVWSSLACPAEKVTAGFADNKGWIFSVKGERGNSSEGRGVNASSTEGGETPSSGEVNP